jgi:hypothetical protein
MDLFSMVDLSYPSEKIDSLQGRKFTPPFLPASRPCCGNPVAEITGSGFMRGHHEVTWNRTDFQAAAREKVV